MFHPKTKPRAISAVSEGGVGVGVEPVGRVAAGLRPTPLCLDELVVQPPFWLPGTRPCTRLGGGGWGGSTTSAVCKKKKSLTVVEIGLKQADNGPK